MNQTNRINEMHQEAMELAWEADRAKKHGNEAEAQALYRRALVLETQAADEVPFGIEPSRSILYRSAATLALDCGLGQEAEQLANTGLMGTPPTDIAAELHEVIERARKREPQK